MMTLLGILGGVFLVGICLLVYGISHGGQNSGYGKPPRWRRSR